MNTTVRLFCLGALLVITAPRLPAPIMEETPAPTAASKSKPTKSSTANAPAKKSTSMADQQVEVSLSDNARAALRYLRDYVENYEKMPFAGKSDEILPRLQQVLSSRFRNVSIITGSSQSRATKGGLIMVLDLEAKVGSWSGTHDTISLSGTFKDSSGKVLKTLIGSGKSTVPYPAFHTSYPKALAAALTEFSQKLSAAR
jgi:hypothetical protein